MEECKFKKIQVKSPNIKYTDKEIISNYIYERNICKQTSNEIIIEPKKYKYTFKVQRKVPKVGVMLVGLAGNNGSTFVGGILANKYKLTWRTKSGLKEPNYYGSITQSTTVRIGSTKNREEVYVPFKTQLPMVNPNDLVISGWDIHKCNLYESLKNSKVYDIELQEKLSPYMKKITPLPSIYYPDFIASNQKERATNLIPKGTKQDDLNHIRNDIREFKSKNNLDQVIIVWTANTERFVDVRPGLNMTADDVLQSIKRSDHEISPSMIFAVASILEGCPYINGSPQNTLVPGIIELSSKYNVFIGGDDFKSGQTKLKSVLVDFLISAGMKPRSIVSYNHLGNNDGKNLSSPKQFRSKEISKSNVVDDMVKSNNILYKDNENPDHVVVIKYVPFVADSKRAIDEYSSNIFMNGINTIVIHNTCEDSLLATPLIIDLVVLSELLTRIQYSTQDQDKFQPFDNILSILSYMLKAPLVPSGTPIVNALIKQQRCIVNIVLACLGISPENDMMLEYKTKLPEPLMSKL